ncbi:MAG: GtrA family protein [Gracilibacteraceae bacterium]|jgi:putative flippase GtrA|nr:GtrA family protein [Gracilibacteraceae bacterium]
MLRFSAVGVVNTMVDASVFTVIVNLTSWPSYAAQCAGYAAGMFNSFIMNRIWTFRRFDAGSITGEALRFFAVNAFSMAASSAAMWLFTDVFKISAFLSKAGILLLTQIINYVGYRFWVFSG